MSEGAYGGHKRALTPLELKSQAVVSSLMLVLRAELRPSVRALYTSKHYAIGFLRQGTHSVAQTSLELIAVLLPVS